MEKQVATFYLRNEYLGIDIRYVREIYQKADIVPVPRTPDAVHGLLNLRGQVFAALDLAFCLGLEGHVYAENPNLMVLKSTRDLRAVNSEEEASELTGLLDDPCCLLIDEIADVVTVDAAAIEPSPTHTGTIGSSWVEGVVQRPDRLLALLDLKAILHALLGSKESV
ncbi:MAG: chemotaxis protein CheW [Verrucomicrobiota bacterium]